jgi:hypothetical protein
MKNFTLLCAMLFCTALAQAQVGIGTTSPDPNSILDIQSSNKGLLIPRVSLSGLNDFSPLSGSTEGLLVYNTNTAIGSGFKFWNGSHWSGMSSTKIDFEDTSFLNNPLYIDSTNGSTAGGILYSHSLNLDKPTLIEVKIHFDVRVRRWNLNVPSNGNPISYATLVTLGNIANGDIIISDSKSFTSTTTSNVNIGLYTLGGNGYIELPAGNHSINVYVFGAGGGNTGFDLTYLNGNDTRFQIIHHN